MNGFVRVIMLAVAVLAGGCASPETAWLADQIKRCWAMGGRDTYDHGTKLFECFRVVASIKVEFNRSVDHPVPGVIKLFEARYEPPKNQ